MLTPEILTYIDIRPLRVTHRSARAIGWLMVVLFGFFLALAIANRQMASMPVFLFFIWLGLLLLCLYGTTEWNTQRICYRAGIGSYEIAWDAVNYIEIDPRAANLVFHGNGQRLVIPGPIFWSGAHKAVALELLSAQIQRHQIGMRKTVWAAYKRSKNTRVRQ